MEIFQVFVAMFSKLSAADLLYVGEGSLLNKVENIVAKGEIAHHKQFHLWPQYFHKSSAAIA